MANYEDISTALQSVMDMQFMLLPLTREDIMQRSDQAAGFLQQLRAATEQEPGFPVPMQADDARVLVGYIDQQLKNIRGSAARGRRIVERSSDHLGRFMESSVALTGMVHYMTYERDCANAIRDAAVAGRGTLRELPAEPPLPNDKLDIVNEQLHVCNDEAGKLGSAVYELRDQVNMYLQENGLPPIRES